MVLNQPLSHLKIPWVSYTKNNGGNITHCFHPYNLLYASILVAFLILWISYLFL